MNEARSCKQCGEQWLADAPAADFYAFLKLPFPSLCPDCRAQRRMTWRNDRTFYVRKSDFSGKQIISIYPPATPFPVFHPNEWYSDLWDPMQFGREYDPSRPFFEQWHQLMLTVPRLGIDIVNCENSDYCNYCGDDKNCYLDIAGEANDECFYNLFTKYSRQCVDCTFVYNSELCYESINCYRCYNVRHSMYLEDCADCSFSFDLKACKNCLFCSNLRRKEYHIFNRAYSKSDYLAEVERLRLDTASGMAAAVRDWHERVRADAIHRDMYALNAEECSGNDIQASRRCTHVFNISDCEDSRYLYDVLNAKDCYDLNYSLYNPERSCELISTLGLKYSACNMASHYCSDTFYSDLCNNSSNLFGCIALNRKEYCILNRQYSKPDYEALKAKIIEKMTKRGEWGEFFPSKLSPFAYNETVANEYFPLTKERAQKAGFSWKDASEKGYFDGPEVQIPDRIAEVPDEIVRQVLRCDCSDRPYKVILPELKFYRKMGLPIPRLSPADRHLKRLKTRNLRTLFSRLCSNCNSAIITSYPPESEYKIYCDGCYLQAVG